MSERNKVIFLERLYLHGVAGLNFYDAIFGSASMGDWLYHAGIMLLIAVIQPEYE